MPFAAVPAAAAGAKIAWGALATKAAPYALAGAQGYMDKRAQDRAFEQNKAFWHERFNKEAQYNSPVEQSARLMAAGLNPALMYKSGAGGGGNVTGPSAQGKIAERYQLGQLALQSAQVGKIVEDTDRVKAESEYIRSKTEGQGTTNKIAVQNLLIKEVEATNAPEKTKQELEMRAKQIMLEAEKLSTQKQMTQEKANLNYKFQTLEKDMIDAGVDVTSGPFQTMKQWYLNTVSGKMDDLLNRYFPQGMESLRNY
jgi:mannitol-specific phosphotransferase system IIBC component